MYRERAARLQKLFLVHNRMGTWKDKKNTLFIPFSEAPPEARVERAMDGMGASHLTQKRFLILHLWKARAHTCTSTHPRPLPESQLMFCFVLFLFPKKNRKAGSLQQLQHGSARQPLAAETAGRLLTAVCMWIQLQLWSQKVKLVSGHDITHPSLFMARRHRDQGSYSRVKLAGSPYWPGTPLSCLNRGRERSPPPTKQENLTYSIQLNGRHRDRNLFLCGPKERRVWGMK